jgi:hypothetical protein
VQNDFNPRLACLVAMYNLQMLLPAAVSGPIKEHTAAAAAALFTRQHLGPYIFHGKFASIQICKAKRMSNLL